MSFIDNIRNYFTRARRQPLPPVSMALPGGRASVDSASTFPTSSWIVVPPNNYEENWQLLTIDSKSLERISPIRLMDILADLSPEVSKALYDFLRLCNPGWEAKAYLLDGETEDARAQAAIDEFVRVLEIDRKYGSFDIIIGRLFTGVFLRGGLCAELVLDEKGRLPIDLATPDPSSIRFRRISDKVLGNIWQAGQWQYGGFVPLDRPTFHYLPIDPMPSSPYGRPLAAPALFTSLFLLGMLHDLKRVIQQQGYPRLDLSVDIEQLVKIAPQIASNAQAFQQFTQTIITSVEDAYRQLKPDDAYIHTSNIQVNKPVGATDSGSLAGIDSVITMLENMSVRALKTMPLMLGMVERGGDVQSNRQYEIFTAGITNIQNHCKVMLERIFTTALQAQGIQATVEFTFDQLRASEELRDAQSEQIQILNEAAKVTNGWQTNDEAAETIVGHPAVGEPVRPQAPQQAPGVGNTDGQPAQQQEQQQEQRWLNEIVAARAEVAKAMEMVSYGHSPLSAGIPLNGKVHINGN